MTRKNTNEVVQRATTVTILFPSGGGLPTGGFRVAYEYANGLADRGWHVRVVHPRTLTVEEIEEIRHSFTLRARRWLSFQKWRVTGVYKPDRWFKVRRNVELLCARTLEPQSLPPSDAWIATYWYTAKWAAMGPGARLYLIQHLETLFGPEAEVMATWKMPLQKIVISRWLEDIARGLGETSHYIPNGLNFEAFGMDVAPETRDQDMVAMLYHHSDWKGSTDGLAAIYEVKSKFPRLKLRLYGIPARPPDLPSWVEYYQNPRQSKLREIYNEAAIFVSPSWTEGWPLPPAEALQCGAALAATDIGGHREYAHHEDTALISPPKNPHALAANVMRLLGDQELRLRLAHRGHEYIQQFTWDRAVTGLESVLKEALASRKTEKTVSTENAHIVRSI